jgi:hypothetical protein
MLIGIAGLTSCKPADADAPPSASAPAPQTLPRPPQSAEISVEDEVLGNLRRQG